MLLKMEIAKKQNYNTIKYNYCQVNLFDKSFYFYIMLLILVANDGICLTSRGSGVRIPHHPPYKQLSQIFLRDKKFDYKQDYFYFEIIIKRDKKLIKTRKEAI